MSSIMLQVCFIARSKVEHQVMGGYLWVFSSIVLQKYDYKLQTCAIVLSTLRIKFFQIRPSGESASHHFSTLQNKTSFINCKCEL